MPSAPSGRYQSRLFNFVNRQSQRLTDQYDRAVRQLKVAAVWGVQILLYPVYLMVQTGLSAGHQLVQSAEAGWPQFKALTNAQPPQATSIEVDTPIQRVLEEVNTLSVGVGSEDNIDQQEQEDKVAINYLPLLSNHQSLTAHLSSSLACPPGEVVTATQNNLNAASQELSKQSCLVQGVATLLTTRALVLITVDNQILDILTPQQQQKLLSKISWEIADLRRQCRLSQASSPRQLTQRRLSSRESQPSVLAPVRLFWHLMAWVQTSPVAVAANLFQEATLIDNTSLSPSFIPPILQASQLQHQQPVLNNQQVIQKLVPSSAITFLDRTVAEIETHQLLPGSEVVVSLSERVAHSIKERTQKLQQQLQTSFVKQDNQAVSPEEFKTNNLGIQALIIAAVEYFFGKQQRSNLPETDCSEKPSILGKYQDRSHELSGYQSNFLPTAPELSSFKLADNTEADPWLSWDDLYGNSQAASKAQNSTSPDQKKIKNKSPAQLPEAFNSKTFVKPGNSILGAIKSYLGFKQPPGKLSAPNTSKLSIETAPLIVQNPGKLKTRSQKKSNIPTKSQTSSADTVSSCNNKALPNKTAASAITTSAADGHLDAAPDWIETPATPNGYVKHPLEQLLGWLDSVMLWLEEFVVKIWRSVRGR